MARMTTELEDEFESEFEDEFEGESEWEGEDEAFLGALGGIARTIGGLLGEGEAEDEYEAEDEFEGEDEFETEDEAFLGALGGIARGISGLLGEGEGEAELEDEDEAEEFFKKIGGFLRKAAPVLRVIAKTAAPLVATAVGGPAAGALARAVTSQLEGEYEGELEAEFEEMATAPVAGPQAYAEYLAAQAAASASESEAETFTGVASYLTLRGRDRRDLERMLPALLRGSAVLTRLLYGDRRTRPAVRLVPGIVDAAGRTLARRAAAGEPVGPVEVGQVLGSSTRRVLEGGPAHWSLLRRHSRGLAHAWRHRRGQQGTWHGYRRPYASGRRRGYPRSTGYGGYTYPGVGTAYRRPVRTAAVGAAGGVPRPRQGLVRVVTPVRVPATASRPARTVRVVSDVPVPRGAVAAGRPVSVSARRRPR